MTPTLHISHLFIYNPDHTSGATYKAVPTIDFNVANY